MLAAASILAGSAGLFDKVGIQYFPPLLYAIPQYGLPTLILTAMLGHTALSRMGKVWKTQWGLYLVMAFVSVFGYITYLISLQTLPVSQVVPLINLNVIFTVLGGIFLLDEKKGWAQKIGGALLAFVGAYLIVG
jgi:drug/metabolite transporter (DMT)-like permease